MKKSKKYIFYIWTLVFTLSVGSLCGCAGSQSSIEETDVEVELLDPVGVAASYDVASTRDLCQAEVFSCVCVPRIEELTYNSDLPFEKYGKLPGESITKGSVLVYGDTAQLDEEYEDLAEEIENKAEDYQDAMTDLQEDLYDAKMDEYEAWEPYIEYLHGEPSESSSMYDFWAMGSMPLEGAYKSVAMAREKVEQSIKEKEELYALEAEYDQGRLARLSNKISQAHVISDMEGTVVAINAISSPDVVEKNKNVIAVGDMSKKTLYTDYISKAAVESAEDIYALVDGKRYEVTYEVMEKEEYTRLKRMNGTVHTTFYLNDPENTVALGDYVTLVVVKQKKKDVLAVLTSSLIKDGQDYYCHLYDGSKSVKTSVSVGMADGLYTEITEGLKEGDMVLTEDAVSAKGKTHTLEKGSVSYEFLGNGVLYYPTKEWVVNPAKDGIFYFKEVYVEKHQQVEAGDALAKIEVIADDINIQRIERKIQRQQERLNRLLEERSQIFYELEDRTLDRAIESRQKAIKDLTEELEEAAQYTGEIVLTAPYAGIVTDITSIDSGELISYKEKLVEIANQSSCYIVIDDEFGQLSYGKEAQISLMLGKQSEKQLTGTVVSVSDTTLSDQMKTGQALILLSKEDVAEIAKYGSTVSSEGDWSRNRFEVRATVRDVSDVVLVPHTAVTVVNDSTYVKLKDEDGKARYVSFIAGGLEQNYYWVADGLSEGMEICLE